MMWKLRRDVTGDTYIHLTFARNIAQGDGFSYNRGEPSNASTSPLWSVILADLYRLVGHEKVLDAGRIVAGLFHLLSILLMYLVVKQVLPGSPVAVLAAFLWALNPNAADWAMRAMDTSLFILVVLLSAFLLSTPLHFFTVEPLVVLGVVLGFVILSRPEGWLWFIISMIFSAMNLGGAQDKSLLLGLFLLSTVVVVSPYYIWMLLRFKTIFPSSTARILHHRQFAERWGPLFYHKDAYNLVVRGLYKSLIPFALLGVALLVYQGFVWADVALSTLLLFTIAIVAVYSFVVPGIDYGYRYILPALPGVIIFSVYGLDLLHQYLPMPVWILLLTYVVWIFIRRSHEEFIRTREFMESYMIGQEEPVRSAMAKWVRDNLPADVTIAAKEVDQLAFHSKQGQRILSIDGLIGGEALPYLQEGKLPQFLNKFRPTHILIEGQIYRGNYPFWSSTELAKLADDKRFEKDGSYKINGLKFTMLHEESFHPFVDMKGKLSKEKVFWRLFSIQYI
ncbi:glycosyltransferase family 39 protein [Candidatus Altiarchaeota archaeon]